MNKIISIRKDWKLIESFIDKDSKILDIGCGEGNLIEQLEKNTNAITHGIEINPQLAQKAISKKKQIKYQMKTGYKSYNKYISRWQWYLKYLLPKVFGNINYKILSVK